MFKPGDRVRAEYWDDVLIGIVTCVTVTTRTYVDRTTEVVTYDVRYGADKFTTRDVHADMLSPA